MMIVKIILLALLGGAIGGVLGIIAANAIVLYSQLCPGVAASWDASFCDMDHAMAGQFLGMAIGAILLPIAVLGRRQQ
jgi:predicted lysophospholipase L1 biosynthesis ABC-type transport system permease subunit